MRVMIVDPDRWLAQLLRQLAESLREDVKVEVFASGEAAERAWRRQPPQLLICGWQLADMDGLSLIARLRQSGAPVPVLLLGERGDRASVLAARRLAVDAFVVKPFRVPRLVEVLRQLLGSAAHEPPAAAGPQDPAAAGGFLGYLAGLGDAALDLPLLRDLRAGLDDLDREPPPGVPELVQRWGHDPALVARLIAVSNNSWYNPNGVVCTTLAEAIIRLGWLNCINIAASMTLRRASELQDPLLAARAAAELERCERVGEHAERLARQCGADPSPCHTAALLHRLGELCVLFHAQAWKNREGECDESLLDRALAQYARPFAERLKSHWGLPMALRELIAAIYGFGDMSIGKREKYVMRLAGGLVHGGMSEEEEARLRRLAGLPPAARRVAEAAVVAPLAGSASPEPQDAGPAATTAAQAEDGLAPGSGQAVEQAVEQATAADSPEREGE
ncbi:HDOD domain-containing protein [Rehaibacterium terrae]|jgi:HD-like signal output (HDOD) protein/CheY-like chemotaxis protein|uniref:HD-like signal output (HDOD) protein/CheY-like chemotaxis protein n=1 Tax=Rehaibacterium terrae TaxID=1341696 RepID=A0A7W7Y226_9GAMM|nr:HDOD domain-containing protein [Rehaibacterium terrae]MBB5016408.1 HD-like signal output (HDOD) protein/CheY-like chemotaxis protein [Rehaibacterium terrae]